MIELAVICVLLVALNGWQQWDRRLERREVTAERRDLLLRIQAPEVAAARDWEMGELMAPPAVRTDDEDGADKDFYESREALAERLMVEETGSSGD